MVIGYTLNLQDVKYSIFRSEKVTFYTYKSKRHNEPTYAKTSRARIKICLLAEWENIWREFVKISITPIKMGLDACDWVEQKHEDISSVSRGEHRPHLLREVDSIRRSVRIVINKETESSQ